MYEPPIRIYEAPLQAIIEQRENAIIAKVQDVFDVQVDKDELLRALQYDRRQYEKGYADGKRDAMASIVRCKDCNLALSHPNNAEKLVCSKGVNWRGVEPNHYCSYGERREGE